MNVPVYDEKNQDRLLGHIPRFDMPKHHDHFCLAAMRPFTPMRMYEPSELAKPHIEQLVFRTAWREDKDGWTMRKVYVTSASLEHLRMVRRFVLPGDMHNSYHI